MLDLFDRPVAPCARAPSLRWVSPLVLTCLLAAPLSYAADTMPPMETASSSTLGAYQKWRDEPLKDWRESNARVEEIGGWRTYLREAQQGGGDAAAPGMHDHHHHGH